MDRLEKAEKLRERADVSYEEAMAALEQTNDDLLEAMVLLERQGKTRKPEQSTYTTSYEEQTEYEKVQEKVEEQEKSAPSFGRTLGHAIGLIIKLVTRTSFHVTRRNRTIFAMPTWVAALILMFFWRPVLAVGIIALFFGVRYSFVGLEQDTRAANDLLEKAGSFADNLEQEMHTEPKE